MLGAGDPGWDCDCLSGRRVDVRCSVAAGRHQRSPSVACGAICRRGRDAQKGQAWGRGRRLREAESTDAQEITGKKRKASGRLLLGLRLDGLLLGWGVHDVGLWGVHIGPKIDYNN